MRSPSLAPVLTCLRWLQSVLPSQADAQPSGMDSMPGSSGKGNSFSNADGSQHALKKGAESDEAREVSVLPFSPLSLSTSLFPPSGAERADLEPKRPLLASAPQPRWINHASTRRALADDQPFRLQRQGPARRRRRRDQARVQVVSTPTERNLLPKPVVRPLLRNQQQHIPVPNRGQLEASPDDMLLVETNDSAPTAPLYLMLAALDPPGAQVARARAQPRHNGEIQEGMPEGVWCLGERRLGT